MLQSDILFLPGEPEFSETLLNSAIFFNKPAYDSPEHALVQSFETGLYRVVDRSELIEYIESGEMDETQDEYMATDRNDSA